MKDSRNPIMTILLGAGFLFMSIAGILTTLIGGLVASGPLGWAAGLAGLALGSIFSTTLISNIGAVIVNFAGYVLQFSSTIFEVLLTYTVIQFGQTLADPPMGYGILSGIKLVWTAFRDISNIIIVGMFVFVAIATILGNTNYGVKKFLVRILTVAVLINFSLLLTQLVVDMSHIAATQFYQGIRVAAVNGQATVQQQSSLSIADIWSQQGGVAGAFQNKMGISSFKDTSALIKKFTSESGFIAALLYIVVATILLLVTAGVFLYGGYLLLARALVIIVLLLTSALAFASWLIPKYGEGKYGWDGWLEALIRSAVFAPLLMMFLWATLTVLASAQPGSMANLLADPKNAFSASKTIIVYLFTIGMLYLSIKIASDFSQKITGFGLAQAGLGWAGRLAGGALGLAGRQSVGQLARMLRGTPQIAGRALAMSKQPVVGLSSGVQRAVGRLGVGLLKNIPKASFNAALLPQAIDDRFKKIQKDYGFKEQGKGGIDADIERREKRSAEAKKADQEFIAKALKSAAPPPTDDQSHKLFDEAVNKRLSDERNYKDQTSIVRKQEQRAEKANRLLEEIGRRESRPGADTATLSRQRRNVESHLAETAENIRRAHGQIKKIVATAEDLAYKDVTVGVTATKREKAMEGMMSDDAFARAEMRSFFEKQKSDKEAKGLAKYLKNLEKNEESSSPAPKPAPRPMPPAP